MTGIYAVVDQAAARLLFHNLAGDEHVRCAAHLMDGNRVVRREIHDLRTLHVLHYSICIHQVEPGILVGHAGRAWLLLLT